MRPDLKEQFEAAQDLRNNEEFLRALALYDTTAQSLAKEGDLEGVADCMHQAGNCFRGAKDYPGARVMLLEARSKFRLLNNHLKEGAVLRDLGLLEKEAGLLTYAAGFLSESVRLLRGITPESLGHLGISETKLALVKTELAIIPPINREKLARANRLADQGVTHLKQSDEMAFLILGLVDRAKIAVLSTEKRPLREALEEAWGILNAHFRADQLQPKRAEIIKLAQDNGVKLDGTR